MRPHEQLMELFKEFSPELIYARDEEGEIGEKPPASKSVEPFYTERAWERYVKGVKK